MFASVVLGRAPDSEVGPVGVGTTPRASVPPFSRHESEDIESTQPPFVADRVGQAHMGVVSPSLSMSMSCLSFKVV